MDNNKPPKPPKSSSGRRQQRRKKPPSGSVVDRLSNPANFTGTSKARASDRPKSARKSQKGFQVKMMGGSAGARAAKVENVNSLKELMVKIKTDHAARQAEAQAEYDAQVLKQQQEMEAQRQEFERRQAAAAKQLGKARAKRPSSKKSKPRQSSIIHKAQMQADGTMRVVSRSSKGSSKEARRRAANISIAQGVSDDEGNAQVHVGGEGSNEDHDDPGAEAGQPEWEAVRDPSSGNVYYWNVRTDETSWNTPDEFVPLDDDNDHEVVDAGADHNDVVDIHGDDNVSDDGITIEVDDENVDVGEVEESADVYDGILGAVSPDDGYVETGAISDDEREDVVSAEVSLIEAPSGHSDAKGEISVVSVSDAPFEPKADQSATALALPTPPERQRALTPARPTPQTDNKSFHKLKHQFSYVSHQVEAGLYSVKRMASLLGKYIQAEEVSFKDISKAVTHEQQKQRQKPQEDHMRRATTAWGNTQGAILTHANTRAEFCRRVNNEVVMPLKEFHQSADAKRKELLTRVKKLQTEINAVNTNVKKNRQAAMQRLATLKQAQQRDSGVATTVTTQSKKQNLLSKFSSKLQNMGLEETPVLKSKAVAALESYAQLVEHANRDKEAYWNRDLPALFSELCELERARLSVVKDRLTLFSQIYVDMLTPFMAIGVEMQEQAKMCDARTDLFEFVRVGVDQFGMPPKTPVFHYDLPCSANDVAANRWDGSMDAKIVDNKTIYGVTLEQVMKRQQKNHANEDIPMIVRVLVKALKELDGAHAEGIFRISANKHELDRFHLEFDEGNYENILSATSPHVAAALLKEWFRELAEPLLPSSFYDECVAIGKLDPIDRNKVTALTRRLPALNARVLQVLCRECLAEIVKNEETKMTVDTLAIVFAPGFIRCESGDPLTIMANNKYEVKFVSELLAYYIYS